MAREVETVPWGWFGAMDFPLMGFYCCAFDLSLSLFLSLSFSLFLTTNLNFF